MSNPFQIPTSHNFGSGSGVATANADTNASANVNANVDEEPATPPFITSITDEELTRLDANRRMLNNLIETQRLITQYLVYDQGLIVHGITARQSYINNSNYQPPSPTTLLAEHHPNGTRDAAPSGEGDADADADADADDDMASTTSSVSSMPPLAPRLRPPYILATRTSRSNNTDTVESGALPGQTIDTPYTTYNNPLGLRVDTSDQMTSNANPGRADSIPSLSPTPFRIHTVNDSTRSPGTFPSGPLSQSHIRSQAQSQARSQSQSESQSVTPSLGGSLSPNATARVIFGDIPNFSLFSAPPPGTDVLGNINGNGNGTGIGTGNITGSSNEAAQIWNSFNQFMQNTVLDSVISEILESPAISNVPTMSDIQRELHFCKYLELPNSIRERNPTCAITQTDFQQETEVVNILRCGHVFERSALSRWFERHSTCPTCRLDIRESARPTASASVSHSQSPDPTANTALTTGQSPGHTPIFRQPQGQGFVGGGLSPTHNGTNPFMTVFSFPLRSLGDTWREDSQGPNTPPSNVNNDVSTTLPSSNVAPTANTHIQGLPGLSAIMSYTDNSGNSSGSNSNQETGDSQNDSDDMTS